MATPGTTGFLGGRNQAKKDAQAFRSKEILNRGNRIINAGNDISNIKNAYKFQEFIANRSSRKLAQKAKDVQSEEDKLTAQKNINNMQSLEDAEAATNQKTEEEAKLNKEIAEQEIKLVEKQGELAEATIDSSLRAIKQGYTDQDMEQLASAGAAFDELVEQGQDPQQVYSTMINQLISTHPKGPEYMYKQLESLGITTEPTEQSITAFKQLSLKATLDMKQRQAVRLLMEKVFLDAKISKSKLKPTDLSYKTPTSAEIYNVGKAMSGLGTFKDLAGKENKEKTSYSKSKGQITAIIANLARRAEQKQIAGEFIAPAEFEAVYADLFNSLPDSFTKTDWTPPWAGDEVRSTYFITSANNITTKIKNVKNMIPDADVITIWNINKAAWIEELRQDKIQAETR